MFSNEDACLSFLEQVRWPKTFQCQKCGHNLF
ncbi:MAG: hypothetical protein B7Y39_16785 [Bdellovibrio sp. 28-41-41]|nr:MAG: hypothetical protein B7Y39_16785 [Bdellovibrio sp. 28-41-41]